jgi:Ni/Fe-hydrogenase 1 B-type cytochrome subunit
LEIAIMSYGTYRVHALWDAPTRWFHWINFLAVIGLMGLGLVILNDKALGISNEGKVLLKTLHVSVGYVLALNLAWRIVWAFIGNRYARWRALLPLGEGYFSDLRAYVSSLFTGSPRQYLGHNPLGRIAITLLLLLLLLQVVTGLVLAGTDIFYPPFGHWIAQWIAAPGVAPNTLVPYAKEMTDESAYEAMRAFREPFVTLHEFGFYGLLVMVFLHITGVVIAELREGGGLVSTMFTGKKIITGPPQSEDVTRED